MKPGRSCMIKNRQLMTSRAKIPPSVTSRLIDEMFFETYEENVHLKRRSLSEFRSVALRWTFGLLQSSEGTVQVIGYLGLILALMRMRLSYDTRVLSTGSRQVIVVYYEPRTKDRAPNGPRHILPTSWPDDTTPCWGKV